MLKVIIIDDEADARFLLRMALKELFPEQIKIVAEADGVKSGLSVIEKNKADLVFLDIKMPDGTGFDLLTKLSDYNFSLVFITAFDHFAIKAFEFSAVGYLVKPFKSSDLRATIQRILISKTENSITETPFKILLENHEQNQIRKLVLPNSDGFVVVKIDEILYINSERNYSEFFLNNGSKVLTSKALINYDNLLSEHGFFRVHHSHLVNLSHVKAFVRSEGGAIRMVNNVLLPVSRQKKAELMERFL
jgi:two-component system, LytTR family, response regulator